jgi:hypothetical protein
MMREPLIAILLSGAAVSWIAATASAQDMPAEYKLR